MSFNQSNFNKVSFPSYTGYKVLVMCTTFYSYTERTQIFIHFTWFNCTDRYCHALLVLVVSLCLLYHPSIQLIWLEREYSFCLFENMEFNFFNWHDTVVSERVLNMYSCSYSSIALEVELHVGLTDSSSLSSNNHHPLFSEVNAFILWLLDFCMRLYFSLVGTCIVWGL